MTYDYIIVGAGSAGCILANRLSASGKYSVLLLEAGGPATALRFKVPVGYVYTYYDPRSNWMYSSQPESELGNRRLYCPRGKVEGGSGSINALIYIRGQRQDFTDWSARGNSGWSFDEVLPYYKKIESHTLGDTAYHGSQGFIRITPMEPDAHPLCASFLQACTSLGYPRNPDFNGTTLEGAGIYDINTRHGMRASSAVAYLHPARSRSNLKVEHHSLVERLLVDADKGVRGVRFQQRGAKQECLAGREVILAAGAVDTPKLLQLSGIGDRQLLERRGVGLVHHLPAVGRNLQDHVCASYYYRANCPTLNDELGSWPGKIKAGLRYLLARRGPLSLSVNQGGAFLKGSPAQGVANIQLYFNPLSYSIPRDGSTRLRPEPYSGFLVAFSPCRPTSRGSVELASSQVADAPLIRPNFLSTEHDREEVLQGSRLVRSIMAAPALQAITEAEIRPGDEVRTDSDMLEYFRQEAGSIYHLCGTCAMGPSAESAVVSDRLRVHGLQGLRIVDASIFPNVTSGNINAPTMMVAEKGADMILEDAGRAA